MVKTTYWNFSKVFNSCNGLLCLIIRGACGEVRLAFLKGSCEKFAVKVISKKQFSVGVSVILLSLYFRARNCSFFVANGTRI